jgi:hypothetical protein
MAKKAPTLDPSVEKERKKIEQILINRRENFTQLLGKDCDFIDALVIREDIHWTDVKALLDRGCPKDKIPEILF